MYDWESIDFDWKLKEYERKQLTLDATCWKREQLRVNKEKNCIEHMMFHFNKWREYFTDDTHAMGGFMAVIAVHNELLLSTTKGIYASKDGKKDWEPRYTGRACGVFQKFTYNGRVLTAVTSKGHYYSTDQGYTWSKR